MDDARELFRQAQDEENAGRLESARVCYERGLELAPQEIQPWLFYANVLRELHHPAEALVALQGAFKGRSPKWLSLVSSVEAHCYRDLQRWDEAEAAYRRSLAHHPNAFVWVLLSGVLQQLGSEDEAEECLRSALALDPNYEEAHCNLGEILKERGQGDEAEWHLRRAIEIDPVYARAHSLLGNLVWKRALQAQKAGEIEHARAFCREARQLLERAVALEPHDVSARMYLGSVLQNTGEEHKAETHYRAALELWPDGSAPHWLLGDLLSSTGQDHAQAGQLLKRAVELDPDDGAAHYYLGRHYLRLHRKFKAHQELQTAARLDNASAQRFLEKLQGDS